jgi:hypothetical protein
MKHKLIDFIQGHKNRIISFQLQRNLKKNTKKNVIN